MANQIATYAKGSFAQWCKLVAGTDQLSIVLLQGTVQADNTLRNYQFLGGSGGLLASNTEATFTNYSRHILTGGVTPVYSTTAYTVTIPITTQTWPVAGGVTQNVLYKLLVCYKPTSASTDAQTCLVAHYDMPTIATTGSDMSGSWASGNAMLGS